MQMRIVSFICIIVWMTSFLQKPARNGGDEEEVLVPTEINALTAEPPQRMKAIGTLHAARCTLHAARCTLHAARCPYEQQGNASWKS